MGRAGKLDQIELTLGSGVAVERDPVPGRPALESHPTYPEIDSADELRDARRVASDLRAVDWTFAVHDTRFLTHDLHPYPAKFIPQLPGHLIGRLSLRGELVFDPFATSFPAPGSLPDDETRQVKSDANVATDAMTASPPPTAQPVSLPTRLKDRVAELEQHLIELKKMQP